MPKSVSAGLLLYNLDDGLHVLLAHPGGPFFRNKDQGAWTIPKGLCNGAEDLLTTAKREFTEETGYALHKALAYLPMGHVTLSGGKVVHAWACAGNWKEGRQPKSNLFKLEWPPRSGRLQSFPEIDRAEMMPMDVARDKINHHQTPFLDRLVVALDLLA